jgi:GNAT superfamily N-acetyltransferase
MHLEYTNSPTDWASRETAEGVTLLSAEEWKHLPPDQHCLLIEGNTVHARCSVWLDSLPESGQCQPAAIGHFEASNLDSGCQLLSEAAQWIQARHKAPSIGPINANTWHKYRLVTERGTRPPFLLEPTHPDFYPEAWAQAGFHPLAEFHSAQMPPQSKEDPRLGRVKARLAQLGIRIRNLDTDDYTEELRRLYSVATISFAENLLYTEIEEADFLELYQSLKGFLKPEYIWLAEHAGRCVGFCFCIPDLAQAKRGEAVDTLIVKTLATLPDRCYAGLGLWLTQIAHQAAAADGLTSVIHALMHPGSRIKHFGKDDMEIFRRYTLYQHHG